jgi:hypothetical protein
MNEYLNQLCIALLGSNEKPAELPDVYFLEKLKVFLKDPNCSAKQILPFFKSTSNQMKADHLSISHRTGNVSFYWKKNFEFHNKLIIEGTVNGLVLTFCRKECEDKCVGCKDCNKNYRMKVHFCL